MYKVQWKLLARDRLADVWLQADDRAEVTAAVHEIDRALAANPTVLGESREGATRIMFEGTLGVTFEALEDQGVVVVLTVWQVRRRH
ncbi:MAG: hypothetical protein ABI353_24400 [Isosphaeraceae bacterium]